MTSELHSRYANYHKCILEGMQTAWQNDNGNEPMPSKLEAMASSFIMLVCDVAYSLDRLAGSAHDIATIMKNDRKPM